MKVYSASEAIWPALLRTYTYLFKPFKWETFLKLATVATISEGYLVTFRFTIPNTYPFDVNLLALKSFLLKPEFLPVTICAAIAMFLVGVYCVYLVVRLRFAFVHSLIHQTRAIRKASRLYPIEAERFFAGNMAVWLAFMVATVLAFIVFVVAGYTVIGTPTPEGKLDPGNFLILFIPCIGIAFLLFLAFCAAQVVLNDFMLPHMSIENLSFGKAWAEARLRIGANKETFLSYFILRLAMPLAAGVILALLGWITSLLVFGVLDMSAAGFAAMLDGSTSGRAHLLTALQLLFVLLGIGAGWVIAVSFGGPLGVFLRSYALYFYGGHYKVLGNLLDPPHAPLEEPESEAEGF